GFRMREALRADAAQSKMTWEFLCEVQASEGERTGARRASCARHSWRRYRWCAEWSSGESAQHRGDRRWVDQKAGWIDASGHATQRGGALAIIHCAALSEKNFDHGTTTS